MTSRRTPDVVLGLVLATSIVLLFAMPLLGVIGCVGLLIAAPPWGRSYSERAIVSLLILAGVIAITVPRASSVPLTPLSAHLGLAAFTAVAVALRYVRRFNATWPRVSIVDVVVAAFAGAMVWWLLAAYIGADQYGVLSGLFHSGWDNHGHFTPFANTIEAGATLWPTIDGSIAWNQWYPSLHSTLWSLAQLATQSSSAALTRLELLTPYLIWTATSFALSMAALAWIGADLASRGMRLVNGGRRARTTASILAVIVVAAFTTFGSPAWLFNYGFTNFVMAIAVMATTSYLSARSWRSARTIGWLLLPLGALSINGMWTPLLLGLMPAGVIVFISLWRVKVWLAPMWAVVSAVVVGGTVVLQSRAITAVDSAGNESFIKTLGSVGIGMTPLNIGAAFAAPLMALFVAAILITRRRWPLAVAVVGSSVMVTCFLVVTIYAAELAKVPPLTNYYVLKTLDVLLIGNAPLAGALAAIAVVTAVAWLRRRPRPRAFLVAAVSSGVGVLIVVIGALIGPTGDAAPLYASVPGLDASVKRESAVADSLIGEALIEAAVATEPYADRATFMWDGSGTLPNLWLASLHGVLSVDQQKFYIGAPSFPYDLRTLEYVQLQQAVNPNLDLVIAWFREVSGALLRPFGEREPDRVTVVQVPMRSSPLCLECSN